MTPPTPDTHDNQIITPRHFLSPKQATETLRRVLDAQDGRLYHPLPTIIDQAGINKEKRSVDGVASVEEISRTYYKIHVAGIDLKQFKKNPVVLACHGQSTWDLMPGVIAMISSITKKENKLHFKGMIFDDDPLSEAWWQKVVKRYVRMTSIGFCNATYTLTEEKGKKGEEPTYYWDIPYCELMEISVCPIGANRGAFIGGEVATAEKSQAVVDLENRIQALTDRLEQLSARIANQDDRQIAAIHSTIERLAEYAA